MRRRAVLGVLLLPMAAYAQRAPAWRIAYLGSEFAGSYFDAFREGLAALGHVEGRTVEIVHRDAGGRLERIPSVVDELLAQKPHVIVAPNTAGAVAAMRATGTVPIVFAAVTDPIRSGLAEAQPQVSRFSCILKS